MPMCRSLSGPFRWRGRFIQSITTGDGSGGNITADVGTLALTNGANINSNSVFGLGQGGNVTVQGLQGPDSLATSVSLDISSINTTIFGGSAATTPSAITITARTLDLANSFIAADTSGAASAGNITLNVDTLTAGHSIISSGSGSPSATAGNAGNITIQGITGFGSPAANVSLDNSSDQHRDHGGSAASTPSAITITAQTLALANDAHIGAEIGADTARRQPANITLNVGTLTAGNSTISSSSSRPFFSYPLGSAAGNAGNITIQGVTGAGSPAAHVSLDNSIVSTTIAGGTSSSIPATIEVTAQTVNLANGSQIKADTSGTAPAGDITLNVDTLTAGNWIRNHQ